MATKGVCLFLRIGYFVPMKSSHFYIVLLALYLQNHICRNKTRICQYSTLSCSSWHKHLLNRPARCICGSDFSQHWALG